MSLVVPQKEIRRTRSGKPHVPTVYFLRYGDSIKVGWSIEVEMRLAQINTYLPEDGELVGTIPGGLSVERSIHRRLRQFHKRGEWFRYCPEVQAMVAQFLANKGVVVAPEIARMQRAHITQSPAPRDVPDSMKALAERLKVLSQEDVKNLALTAGVPANAVGRAAADISINISDFLKICGAVGFDPIRLTDRPIVALGDFDTGMFALGLDLCRRLRGHTLRDAAQVSGSSLATHSRAENRYPLSIKNVMALSRYMGTDPFGYCVSRGTDETPPALLSADEPTETREGAAA